MARSSLRSPGARLAILIAVAFALVFTGAVPRRAARAPVVLNIAGCWTSADQGPFFVRVVEGFNKVQSAIHIVGHRGVSAAQVLTQVSAGNPPDVYFDCNPIDVGQWAANGYALNLDPYIQQAHFDVTKIIPSARAWSTYNGHLYSLPLLEDTFMLIYNRKLFRAAGISRPPVTIEEMTTDAYKLTKKDSGGRLTQLGFGPVLFGGDYIGTWLPVYVKMFGGSMVDPSGKKITANCAECVKALQWEADFYKTIGAAAVDRIQANQSNLEYTPANLFTTGKVAMIVNGEYYTGVTQAYGPKNLDWSQAPLPYPAARPDLANSGIAGGNPGFILKGTKHPFEAFKFMEYMQSVGPTVAFANFIHNVPQLYAAQTSPMLDPNPHFRTFVKYAGGPKVGAFVVLPIGSDFAAGLTGAEDLVVHGKMSAKQGLDKLTLQMQQKLDQFKSGL